MLDFIGMATLFEKNGDDQYFSLQIWHYVGNKGDNTSKHCMATIWSRVLPTARWENTKIPQAGHNAQVQGILYIPMLWDVIKHKIGSVPGYSSASRWQTFLTQGYHRLHRKCHRRHSHRYRLWPAIKTALGSSFGKEELQSLEENGTWIVQEISQMPIGCKPILGKWAFKRKELPDGGTYYKARLIIRGFLQHWLYGNVHPYILDDF